MNKQKTITNCPRRRRAMAAVAFVSLLASTLAFAGPASANYGRSGSIKNVQYGQSFDDMLSAIEDAAARQAAKNEQITKRDQNQKSRNQNIGERPKI